MRIDRFHRSANDSCEVRRVLRSWLVVVAIVWLGMGAGMEPIAYGQVELNRFFPPVVTSESESTVKAEGKFPQWPVSIICDRDDVVVTAGEESGSLVVKTAADTAPGVAWIRLHDSASASKLTPLLVEGNACVAEVEPNNKRAEASVVELAQTVYGRLDKSGDIDSFRVRVQGGQTLVAMAVAHEWLRSPMDMVLQLADLDGNVLLQVDDGRGLDPQLTYKAPQDAEFILRVFAFPETPDSTIGYAGAESFVYALRVTDDAFVDHVLPLVSAGDDSLESLRVYGWNLPEKLARPNRHVGVYVRSILYEASAMGWQNQIANQSAALSVFESENGEPARAESLPMRFSGHIATRGEVDRVRFAVSGGAKYQATVHARSFGLPLDSVVRVVDVASGAELGRNDDASGNRYDASLTFSSKEDAEVELQMFDLVDGFGPRHGYTVVVEPVVPTAELTVAADQFVMKAGESIDVPVTITRLDGFAEELQITAEGLPAGVEVTGAKSEAKGDSSKAVVLKLAAGADVKHQGAFRIVAKPIVKEGDANASRSFLATHRLRDTVHVGEFWLTVTGPTP